MSIERPRKLWSLATTSLHWLGKARVLVVLMPVAAVSATVAVLTAIGSEAVLVMLVGLTALMLVGLIKVRLDIAARLRRTDNRMSETNQHLSTALGDLAGHVESHGRRVQTLENGMQVLEQGMAHIAEQVSQIRGQVGNPSRPGADYRQVEALFGLYHLLNVEQPVPPMRGWAASPDFLLQMISHILGRRPRMMLECGSGVSTLFAAHALRRNGGGQVHALEHDERFVEQTNTLLDIHGVGDWARVTHAPLETITLRTQPWSWYTPAALQDLEMVDIAVVDGPPSGTQPLARYPALPMVYDRLAPQAVIILDDYKREDERAVVERWLREFEEFSCLELDHEKGTAVLTR